MAFRSNWIDALALITQGCMDAINRLKQPNTAVLQNCGENVAETAILAAVLKCQIVSEEGGSGRSDVGGSGKESLA